MALSLQQRRELKKFVSARKLHAPPYVMNPKIDLSVDDSPILVSDDSSYDRSMDDGIAGIRGIMSAVGLGLMFWTVFAVCLYVTLYGTAL